MNNRKFALCMMGCGSFAQTVAESLEPAREQLDLYFASRDPTRARDYCRRFRGQGYFGSYETAAADPRVEAMYVCTPHHLHWTHVALAAGHGKHVLVEKPLARTLDEGAELIGAAKAAGVTLMVAENYHFLAQARRCRELVAQGAVGDLRLVQLQEENRFTPVGWRTDAARNGGGVFIDGGIHKVHFLRCLAGPPQTVYAAELPKAMAGHAGEDGMVMVARWPSGLVGLINHSWAASARHTPPTVAVSGSEGLIRFDVGSGRISLHRGGKEETWELDPDYRGCPAMLREFRDSVRQGREPEMSGAEGLADLALVLAAYESARAGASVAV